MIRGRRDCKVMLQSRLSHPSAHAPLVGPVLVSELPFHFLFLKWNKPKIEDAELRQRRKVEGQGADVDRDSEKAEDHADIHWISREAERPARHERAIGRRERVNLRSFPSKQAGSVEAKDEGEEENDPAEWYAREEHYARCRHEIVTTCCKRENNDEP
jgi:hypothetical protein